MPDKSISDYYDQARAKIKAEEEFKALLNDRSGPPAARPSQDFIDLCVGKPRTAEEMAAAIKERAEMNVRADRTERER
jgi:ubiquinone/menaquinone biosynthesis C-methylase UbiE